jgi:hypothetical protein
MSRKRLRSDDELDGNPPPKRPRGGGWKVPADLDLQVNLWRWALIRTFQETFLFCAQTDRCAALLNALKKCKGSDSKQPLGDFLMRVPSKRVCPSYSDIVTQPIDLMKIQVSESSRAN